MIAGWVVGAVAQAAPPSSALLRELHDLRVVGSVLYVGAHPDDENTQLLAWLEGQGLRAGYLSMTRGDGGQNLVGSEQDELLGVLRTGELLAARSVDGAEQWFTRARDFGYSKSSEEALRLWGHDDALDDVVRVVRTFRPDVIVTRFPPEGDTHGHHLASAILAAEAFTAAADPAYATPGLEPWAATRIVWNRSNWNLDPSEDTSAWGRVDTGTYDPLLGASFGEVAAVARTNHESQGFGSEPDVLPDVEYFVGTAGAPLPAGGSPLAGVDTTWARFPGAERFDRAVAKAERRFDPEAPERVLPLLAEAHRRLADIPDPTWRAVKGAALERWMADAVGLWLTARADRPAVAPGGAVKVSLTALARAEADVELVEVALEPGDTTPGARLARHAPWTAETTLTVPVDAPLTRPHWLIEAGTRSRYTIADPATRIVADTPPRLVARFRLRLAGEGVEVVRPVEFAETDRVDGERVRPLEVLPPVTATFAESARALPTGASGATRLTLRATSGPADGVLRLAAPPGITATPTELVFHLADGGEQVVEIALSAAAGAAPGELRATVEVGGRADAYAEHHLDYRHVPYRTVLSPAVLPVVPLAVARGGVERVGYVVGSGDAVPDGLRAMGYSVEELGVDAIASADLSRFDVVVMGIRAYNTHPRLLAQHDRLMDWVAAGGRLVVQYNTTSRWDPLVGSLGPAPLTLGRGRVTDEDAALTPVDPASPALTAPNPLGPADFEGWVQERGLYFAESWDPAYTPVFSTHDPGEEALLGSTLVAHHGQGVFVYTGLSFFRQLPAGVPGAYRLLANLLATP